MTQATHRVQARPQIAARYLADLMVASERRRRSLLQMCKFRPIARIIQHDEAKQSVGRFLRSGRDDTAQLEADAERLERMLTETDFERQLYDANADYIRRFAGVAGDMAFPKADLMAAGSAPALTVAGVKLTVEFAARLQRRTKYNDVRIGAVALRYEKGKPLKEEVGAFHSAIIHGYLARTSTDDALPEQKLCAVLDVWTGNWHYAPGNAVTRFNNAEAMLATIADVWGSISPPAGAVI